MEVRSKRSGERRFQKDSAKSISSVGGRHGQIEQQQSVLTVYACSWSQYVYVYTETTAYTSRYMARTRGEGVSRRKKRERRSKRKEKGVKAGVSGLGEL